MQDLVRRNGPRLARLAARQRLRTTDAGVSQDHIGVEQVQIPGGDDRALDAPRLVRIRPLVSIPQAKVSFDGVYSPGNRHPRPLARVANIVAARGSVEQSHRSTA